MPKRWNQAIQDRDEQRAMKRQAVLIAGARLFHQQGYDRTSLDDIAKALGVTKPSLYYYVKNKDEILFEVISKSLHATGSAFERATLDGNSGLDRLRIFFREYVLHLYDDFGRCAAGVDFRYLDSDLRRQISDARKAIDVQVRQLVEQGQADGSIAGVDPRLATFFLFGAFNWIVQWHRDNGPSPREEIVDVFMLLASRALGLAVD